jgi:hypothetical protein
MVQNHIGNLIVSMDLEKYGGWSVVRNIMSKELQQITGAIKNDVYEYFTDETMPYKCFLRMRMQETNVSSGS